MSSYTIALLGNGGVGKTSFIRGFIPKYNPTIGIDTYTITFGSITLHFLDYAGQEIYSHKPVDNADLAIIMYDLSSPISYKIALDTWTRIAANTPILYVANKSDVADQRVSSNHIKISSKNNPTSINQFMNSIITRLSL
jgi:GTPase SAR1 family protein